MDTGLIGPLYSGLTGLTGSVGSMDDWTHQTQWSHWNSRLTGPNGLLDQWTHQTTGLTGLTGPVDSLVIADHWTTGPLDSVDSLDSLEQWTHWTHFTSGLMGHTGLTRLTGLNTITGPLHQVVAPPPSHLDSPTGASTSQTVNRTCPNHKVKSSKNQDLPVWTSWSGPASPVPVVWTCWCGPDGLVLVNVLREHIL